MGIVNQMYKLYVITKKKKITLIWNEVANFFTNDMFLIKAGRFYGVGDEFGGYVT